MAKILSGLGVLSTMIILIVVVTILAGKTEIKFNMNADEKGVAETIQWSGFKVPVLVQAYPDDLDKMDVVNRRDAWCGKISVCNNLYQFGIKYTLTSQHVCALNNPIFEKDLLSMDYTLNVNFAREKFIHSKGIKYTDVYYQVFEYSPEIVRNKLFLFTIRESMERP